MPQLRAAPMRIRIAYSTIYAYGSPSKAIIQRLRLTPRSHDGQHVSNWRIDVDADGRLRAGEDAFGNITHMLSVAGPIDSLKVMVTGQVETVDMNGLVSGTVERLPDLVYLRETPLTEASEDIRSFARDVYHEGPQDELSVLHRLLSRIHHEIAFDTEGTDASTTASAAFALKRGVCQDLSHIFIACARHLGIPARYISGHFLRSDGVTEQNASHAWVEAKVPGLGWVGFDPANGICPTDAHVRVSCALDYLGAAPFRGSRFGGGQESLDVTLSVTDSTQQSQA